MPPPQTFNSIVDHRGGLWVGLRGLFAWSFNSIVDHPLLSILANLAASLTFNSIVDHHQEIERLADNTAWARTQAFNSIVDHQDFERAKDNLCG